MGQVIITVTCDWDGLDYPLGEPYNPEGNPHFRFDRGVQAIQYFNKVFENCVPITHFICPVYFTRSKALVEYYARNTTHLIKESNCEIGLHIHGWMSLMHACDIWPRDPVEDPSVPDWGAQENSRYGLCVPYLTDDGHEKIDYGHGVPLGAYRQEEISQIVKKGRELLVDHRIMAAREDCVSFRCGGWMANDAVYAALQTVEPSFQYEASAVDASFFAGRGGILDRWLAQLWGSKGQPEHSYLANRLFLSAYPDGINIWGRSNDVAEAQPRRMQKLLEIPDTAILADYVKAGYMVEQIDGAVALAALHASDIYVSLGFHLESGGDPRFGKVFGHIEEVIAALEHVNQQYARHSKVQYLSIAEAGRRLLQNSISKSA
ncbi:MAG: hypothetical protein ACREOO_22790 [bacterium]